MVGKAGSGDHEIRPTQLGRERHPAAGRRPGERRHAREVAQERGADQ